MDPEVSVLLHCAGWRGLLEAQVQVELSESCSLTSEEVRELYWRGGAEAHESTDILFLSRTDMLRLDRNAALWAELCPSAKGAVLLYQLVAPDGGRDERTNAST
ncbi:uridine diphosphate glucose pyrophosphatase NUDT22 [Diretmus argenteus]